MLGNKGSKKFYRTGGTRGGQDKFNWEDVKSDKDRENYLGHSLQAPVGRWQKGKDLLWYAKNKNSEQVQLQLEEEKRRMRELDNEMLNSALGIRSSSKRQYSDTLDAEEMKQLMARGQLERDEAENTERIKGLGAAPAKTHEHLQRMSHLEMQIQRLKEGKEELVYDDLTRLPGTVDPKASTGASSERVTANEGKEQDDQQSSHRSDSRRRRDGDRSDDSGSDSRDERKHKNHKKEHKKDHKKDHKKEHKHSKPSKHSRDRDVDDRDGDRNRKHKKHNKDHHDQHGSNRD